MNGEPASHEDYKASQRKAFNGLCLAIIQTGHETGEIRIAAQSQGLQSASVELTVGLHTTGTPAVLP